MTAAPPAHPWGDDGEPPQAIAEDYPGWGIKHDNGRWTAWCPAITIHADTPAALRAAIEEAIWGDVEH